MVRNVNVWNGREESRLQLYSADWGSSLITLCVCVCVCVCVAALLLSKVWYTKSHLLANAEGMVVTLRS